MAHYKFNKDLIEGEEGELVVIEQLKNFGATLIHQNKDNRYDVLVERNGKNIKYEIKTDVYCKPDRDTGNMFIETECRGKKSGINVTQAEWFVYFYPLLDEIWYIKTKDLLNLIQENVNTLRFHKNGGDPGSRTKGWLIPRKRFLESFIVLDAKTNKRKKTVKKGEKGKVDYDRLMKLLNKK